MARTSTCMRRPRTPRAPRWRRSPSCRRRLPSLSSARRSRSSRRTQRTRRRWCVARRTRPPTRKRGGRAVGVGRARAVERVRRAAISARARVHRSSARASIQADRRERHAAFRVVAIGPAHALAAAALRAPDAVLARRGHAAGLAERVGQSRGVDRGVGADVVPRVDCHVGARIDRWPRVGRIGRSTRSQGEQQKRCQALASSIHARSRARQRGKRPSRTREDSPGSFSDAYADGQPDTRRSSSSTRLRSSSSWASKRWSRLANAPMPRTTKRCCSASSCMAPSR